MMLLAITIVSTWSLTSLAAGLGLGAVIRMADRVHDEEILETLLSALAERQLAR